MKNVRLNLEKHMRRLCFDFPSRHCGSENELKCAEYIEEYWKNLGLDVRSEYYPVRGWDYRSFEFVNETKGITVPAVLPNYFSCSCDVRGSILVIGDKDLTVLDTINVKNRICLVTSLAGNVFTRGDLAKTLEKMEAAAVIFISTGNVDSVPQTKLVRNQKLEKIAALAVANPGIFHLLSNRDDTYRLRVDANNFDTRSRNVIARIGSGPLAGVLGAHYDTAPFLQGADDNGTGTSMLLEMGRMLRDCQLPFSVDLCAFSAEEYIPEPGGFPLGSGTYVEMHKDEDIRWFQNFDGFANRFGEAIITLGHPEKLPPISYPDISTVPARLAGDDKTFYYAGIPTVWLCDTVLFHNLHTPLDTFEKVDLDRLAYAFEVNLDLFRQLTAASK